MTLLREERASAPVRLALPDRGTWLIAALAALAWLPNLLRPATADEAGFLMVGAQWHPGTSLYGDYWVDRPPLLIAVHGVAALLGGLPALRVIGLLCVVATVLLAGAVAAEASREAAATVARRTSLLTAALAAALIVSPALGAGATCGELLTTPVVLAAVLAALRATRDGVGTRRSVGWVAVAGAVAMLAPLLKQNALDGLVAVTAMLLLGPVAGERRRRVRLLAVAAAGTAAVLLAALLGAALLGTSPLGLWDAVVTFRLRAGAVIATDAPAGNDLRAERMLGSLLGSGLPLTLLVLGLLRVRGSRTVAGSTARALTWVALAMLAWEAVAVLGGGSWWRHYLLNLVPGAVVLAAVALPRARRLATPLLAVVVPLVVTALALAATVPGVLHGSGHRRERDVVAYLTAHARPGDTGTVAFGHPDLLRDAGLRSPYDELWSLPVRVRDPHLDDLLDVLEGSHAPTWVVTGSGGVATWGVDPVDAARADAVLARRYHRAALIDGYAIWHRPA